jgi:hypothetical protein
MSTVQRFVERKNTVLNVPEYIKVYREEMGGVDAGDRLRLSYGVEKAVRFNKPWFKLFVGLMDAIVANVTLCALHYRPKVPRKQMLFELVDGLVERSRQLGAPDGPAPAVRRGGVCAGQLETIAAGGGWGGQLQGSYGTECVVCRTDKSLRKRRRTHCSACGLTLCRGACFQAHKLRLYKPSKRHRRKQHDTGL